MPLRQLAFALARIVSSASLLLLAALPTIARAQQPIRVAIVGLNHGHVLGFLHNAPEHTDIELVGISEPKAELRDSIEKQFHLDHKLFFSDEKAMLETTHPQAILVYTSPLGHLPAIRIAAPMHIAAMVEKPLATTVPDALEIQRLSEQNHVPVLTNYETTWYRSNTAAIDLQHAGKIGEVRRIVAHDGHKGPKEIGVGPDFLAFLSDRKQNGGGALFDFGCYGVDLATVLMHGELPLSVTAITHTDKPDVYPNTDDEATILLQYPKAVANIEGSWNWPFDVKDFGISGSTGYINTVYTSADPGNAMSVRLPGEKQPAMQAAPPLPAPQDDSLHYLVAVLNGSLHPQGDLTALDTNVKVVRILAAARESAATHRTVTLSGAK